MAGVIRKIKGTEDILPRQSYKWQFVERIMAEEARVYGFSEIRTPVFEQTELFKRGVGEGTDVVQKEMYTFETRGGESLTLRPEGTAGAVRAFLEHGLFNDGYPVKVDYFTTCYRYEKPQAGRQREFHQFGMEVFGASEPIADAELICAASSILSRLGLENVRLEINSIGCPECRKVYYEKLREYFNAYRDELCETCLTRIEKNPMRILDCKSPICKKIAENAPKITDYLCESCEEHFARVKSCLDNAGIKYTVNPSIVRGLDYYTNTVFEFIADGIGAQSTVCGGGRYNGLVEELGGNSVPALGFAMGIERLLLTLESQGIEISEPEGPMLYIATMGERAEARAFALVKELREASITAQYDIVGRGLKAQMKYADKIKAAFSIVLGDDEIERGSATVKNMKNGNKTEISLSDGFLNEFFSVLIDAQSEEINV